MDVYIRDATTAFDMVKSAPGGGAERQTWARSPPPGGTRRAAAVDGPVGPAVVASPVCM